MTYPRTATLAPSIPASATVAAGPLRADRQDRSLAITSNPAPQHQRQSGTAFSASDGSVARRRSIPKAVRQARLPCLGHAVEP